jgi:hypothetical protein
MGNVDGLESHGMSVRSTGFRAQHVYGVKDIYSGQHASQDESQDSGQMMMGS